MDLNLPGTRSLPKPKILIELRHDTSVRYVRHEHRSEVKSENCILGAPIREIEEQHKADFEANLDHGSQIYVGSMLDRLLPQSFFNPHISMLHYSCVSCDASDPFADFCMSQAL